ncbi:predicted protein [Aspergillus terreus NIH2624]|uniref:Uncharacterized protein n=1 Tax=Aspergillus terreus (strain NIH 2624 / FGSC A1156) TaxID=341663 RepID=Q0CI92_ASPTN|nr:uncharacterized protein ATEG_06592 [Aspergillus terreus NIH2624]EAU33136.1 predicted protein [Aspergillus terreus NIH2624]
MGPLGNGGDRLSLPLRQKADGRENAALCMARVEGEATSGYEANSFMVLFAMWWFQGRRFPTESLCVPPGQRERRGLPPPLRLTPRRRAKAGTLVCLGTRDRRMERSL